MTFATSLSTKVHSAADRYKQEVLLPLAISSASRHHLNRELDTIVTAFCEAQEKTDHENIITWKDTKLALAGQEISPVASESALVIYLLYQHFGSSVAVGKIRNLTSWSQVERNMEVLKTAVDLSKKIMLTITPPPVTYKLEPVKQDYRTGFEYQLERNLSRQVHYLAEWYEERVLAQNGRLHKVKKDLAQSFRRILQEHLTFDSVYPADSDILFEKGKYRVGKEPKRPMRSVMSFLLFHFLYHQGEPISEEAIRNITNWKKIPECINVLQDYIAPSQIFALEKGSGSYTLVRKKR